MHVLTVIPVRIGSRRLREKPLRSIHGEALISIVAQRAVNLGVSTRIVVAADDARVLDAVAHLPVDRILTGPHHKSGTERIAEVLRRPEYANTQRVLNLQVDQPFLPSEAAEGALRMVESGFAIGTAAVPLDPVHQSDRNIVKVAVSRASRAGRFARTLTATEMASGRDEVLHHLGVYAYTRAAVLQWVGLPACVEEHTERLEQLRPMANGMSIGVAILDCVAPLAIDTESDLQRVRSSQVSIRDQSRKSA